MLRLGFKFMRTIIYVDGFNLYYRMLKNRPDLKWLNPLLMAQNILNTSHHIIRLNYYIARISARVHDPEAPARQAVYLSALATVPEIAIHEGNFMISEPWMPLTSPARAKPDGYVWAQPLPDVVKVVKSEEKGSDVNLASHLVRDAFLDAFDVAVVVTNDSDLVEPMRIVRDEAKKRVGLLIPVKSPSQSLVKASSFQLHISNSHLSKAQFAEHITRSDGRVVNRPLTWF